MMMTICNDGHNDKVTDKYYKLTPTYNSQKHPITSIGL